MTVDIAGSFIAYRVNMIYESSQRRIPILFIPWLHFFIFHQKQVHSLNLYSLKQKTALPEVFNLVNTNY
jgi:hypothetical protein